jgi:photosystem II stability/assembly factor-like uncharacterized protein
VDPRRPANVFVGVVNDKETGGVFQSTNGGVSWKQNSDGLGGRDVFSLGLTPDGVVLAGTNHGIFRLEDGFWLDSSAVMSPRSGARKGARSIAPQPAVAKPGAPVQRIDDVVYALVRSAVEVFAGTSEGLLRSNPDGTQWEPVKSLSMTETRFVAVQKSTVFVSGLKQMALSLDSGAHWTPVGLPPGLTQVSAIAVDDQKSLWAGGREGVFFSSDNGANWKPLRDLAINQVDGIYFDAAASRVLLTCADSSVVFSVSALEHKVNYWDSGWKLRFARPMGDYLLGVTLYDGVVVQPKMVDSSVAAAKVGESK